MNLASALVTLVLAAGGADPGKLLPRVEGWKLQAPPTLYTPETLFEYIDGGADAFLHYDFQELVAATFVNAKKVEVTADLYRHRDAGRAFGMYSQERRPGSGRMPGQLEGVSSPDHLEFVAGPFYVKLALPAGGNAAILPLFAEKIAAKLPGARALPPVLGCFPERGKKPRAEKLIARDFLGYAFLHDAAVVPYESEGARFRLFAVEGRDAAEVRAMLAALRDLSKQPKAEIPTQGEMTLKDPHNGELMLAWSGPWLWGAVDDPSPARKSLIEELGRRLSAINPR